MELMKINVNDDHVNILWNSQTTRVLNQEFWRFQIHSGSPYVGMTTESFFGQGYYYYFVSVQSEEKIE